MYGPVPTGCLIWASVFGAFTPAVGDVMPAIGSASAAGSAGNALLRWITAVVSFGASTLWITVKTLGSALYVFGLLIRSRLHFAAAALNGVPSLNLTPVRSV